MGAWLTLDWRSLPRMHHKKHDCSRPVTEGCAGLFAPDCGAHVEEVFSAGGSNVNSSRAGKFRGPVGAFIPFAPRITLQ